MIACHNGRYNGVYLILAAFLTMSIPSHCPAVPIPSVGLSGGLEGFHLKEIDSSGTRLLSETGRRYVATAFLDDSDKYEFKTPLLYHLEASTYWGQVDYEGMSQSITPGQNNLPLLSQTDYLGGRAEAMVGYRFMLPNHSSAIELLGGMGVDGWKRRIHSAVASDGTAVSGIEERYTAYYGKIALGLSNLYPSGWYSHLQFGVKIPVDIIEYVYLSKVGYDNDLTLNPGNTLSGFVDLQFESSHSDKAGNPVFRIYYDAFRFDPSAAKSANRGTSTDHVWQPETRIDIFGLQIGYRF